VPFGATTGSILLGPDLAMGQGPVNAPSIGGTYWDTANRTGETFLNNVGYVWIRGHLINGRWGGSGGTWNNLTPLTALANSNHKTVEKYMDDYIIACLNYERAADRDFWYGVYYSVRCSVNPLSDVASTNNNNLHSYAPEFIKVSWRAIVMTKPVGQFAGLNVLFWQPVAAFPVGFNVPVRSQAIGANQTLPTTNVPGGLLLGAPPINFPLAQANGFDGDIEIHQT
jgi:hypothetical protein